MTELHEALESLRPKDFSQVPTADLRPFLSDLFSKAELIANSVPPPPNGTPFETSRRTRTDADVAASASELTVSEARRPPPQAEHAALQKAWGKPLKLSSKDSASGISAFKMAGHDRHGAWFARTSVHEGLGFAKWKRAMMREFPESLAVEGKPGEGNVRGIGSDKRLEDIHIQGTGKLEVYQLSAQFPGPVAPREFITLLITSENALSSASQVCDNTPRHYMVVSIPVTHPDAPPREGMVRGFYESVEMIREIPLTSKKSIRAKSRDRGNTIGFAESRGPEAKGERIDRRDEIDIADPERNPVEWIMVTRSDPGGGIPRFMVERSTPASIVQDAVKFLNWACAQDDLSPHEEDEQVAEHFPRQSLEPERAFSIPESNGILAGVGSSIVDKPNPSMFRRSSQDTKANQNSGIISAVTSTVQSHVPDILNPLQRTDSHSSTTTSSSVDSFASAEQFNTAPEGLNVDGSTPTPSGLSGESFLLSNAASGSNVDGNMSRELQKIELKRQQLKEKLAQARDKQGKETEEASLKSAKELEKAAEKHNRERKRQEEKFAKEVEKLEARRERETKKLLARQQKEADKNNLLQIQRERDEWKGKSQLAEEENKLLKEQIGELQRENTALVAKLGKSEYGLEILKKVREDMEGTKGDSRRRASSRASADSSQSRKSASKKSEQSTSVSEES